MKYFKKILLSLFFFSLAFILPSCSFKNASTVNDSFKKFTLSLFRQEASSTTINLHYTLQKPSEYGILNAPVTYGAFTTDSVSAMASIENCQSILRSFPYHLLTKENQLTFDVLNDYLETAKEGGKYLLYDEPLSPITGIQAQLPFFLPNTISILLKMSIPI